MLLPCVSSLTGWKKRYCITFFNLEVLLLCKILHWHELFVSLYNAFTKSGETVGGLSGGLGFFCEDFKHAFVQG